jgi:hypothetical protein
MNFQKRQMHIATLVEIKAVPETFWNCYSAVFAHFSDEFLHIIIDNAAQAWLIEIFYIIKAHFKMYYLAT